MLQKNIFKSTLELGCRAKELYLLLLMIHIKTISSLVSRLPLKEKNDLGIIKYVPKLELKIVNRSVSLLVNIR